MAALIRFSQEYPNFDASFDDIVMVLKVEKKKKIVILFSRLLFRNPALSLFLIYAFFQYGAIKCKKHEILGIFLPAPYCIPKSLAFFALEIWIGWHN